MACGTKRPRSDDPTAPPATKVYIKGEQQPYHTQPIMNVPGDITPVTCGGVAECTSVLPDIG